MKNAKHISTLNIYKHIDTILKQPHTNCHGIAIGFSRKGTKIEGFKFGNGTLNISLIAGNHADEPIGPLLLKKLVSFLSTLEKNHDLLSRYSWYIIPHTNPDGEQHNLKWYDYTDTETSLYRYFKYALRELPGDDMEFGYPIKNKIDCLRPENEAVYNFWKTANSPFNLHASLHGMGKSYGAWFLIDQHWADKTRQLQADCKLLTHQMGYDLFDLDRNGEKGFFRIAEGFSTRPDSEGMRKHFLALNDQNMANKFHPSSMESIRSLGGDCLTLVTEMPLFIFPKKERILNWPDPYLKQWSSQFANWKRDIISGKLTEANLLAEMKALNVKPMPWEAQLRLQWQFIASGIKTITEANNI